MPDGTAIIADPRNDENMIVIAGLQAAFLLLPQPRRRSAAAPAATDIARAVRRGAAADDLALPVDDPARVPAAVRRAATGRRRPAPRPPVLPARQGRGVHPRRVPGRRLPFRPLHGQAVLPRQPRRRQRRALLRLHLRRRRAPSADPDDLRGGFRAPRRFVGWQTFFDFGDGQVKRNKRIDTRVSTPLFHLPLGAIASHAGPTALPVRTLLRHITWQLPSGQAIARRIGVTPLGPPISTSSSAFGLGLERSTPLWYYVAEGGRVDRGRPPPRPGRRHGSSPRSSSACCRRTHTPISPSIRAGGPTLPGARSRTNSGWSTSSPSPAWIPRAEGSRRR